MKKKERRKRKKYDISCRLVAFEKLYHTEEPAAHDNSILLRTSELISEAILSEAKKFGCGLLVETVLDYCGPRKSAEALSQGRQDTSIPLIDQLTAIIEQRGILNTIPNPLKLPFGTYRITRPQSAARLAMVIVIQMIHRGISNGTLNGVDKSVVAEVISSLFDITRDVRSREIVGKTAEAILKHTYKYHSDASGRLASEAAEDSTAQSRIEHSVSIQRKEKNNELGDSTKTSEGRNPAVEDATPTHESSFTDSIPLLLEDYKVLKTKYAIPNLNDVLDDAAWASSVRMGELFRPYGGRYVAIADRQIRGTGDTDIGTRVAAAKVHHVHPERLWVLYVEPDVGDG